MPPYQAGSNMAHEIDVASCQLEHAARRFGAGTPNVAGPVGLAAAIDYLESLGRERIERHESHVTRYALERLSEVRGLKLLGPAEPIGRIPVFSFTLKGVSAQEVMQRVDGFGIAIRAGDLAALPLLKRLGATTAARASCYLYTQTGDIDRLVEALNATRVT
jgi:cysteine desulfurase/selenocysteine lyase